jgi:hypothetical protein
VAKSSPGARSTLEGRQTCLTRPLDSVTGTTDRFVTFLRPHRDISQLILFTSSSHEAIDDLTFNSPVTPEPGTPLLLASGLLLMRRGSRQSGRSGGAGAENGRDNGSPRDCAGANHVIEKHEHVMFEF